MLNPTPTLAPELSAERVQAVKADAVGAARLFVSGFKKSLDPDETCWDIAAAIFAASLRDLTGEHWARAQKIFQATLIEESARLCATAGGNDSGHVGLSDEGA
jgi:hypothetical protein